MDFRNSYRVQQIEYAGGVLRFDPQVRQLWWPFWTSLAGRWHLTSDVEAKQKCEDHARFPAKIIIWTSKLP